MVQITIYADSNACQEVDVANETGQPYQFTSFPGIVDTYNQGDYFTITAVPKSGYTFVNWQDQYGNTSTDNPWNTQLLDYDLELTAVFSGGSPPPPPPSGQYSKTDNPVTLTLNESTEIDAIFTGTTGENNITVAAGTGCQEIDIVIGLNNYHFNVFPSAAPFNVGDSISVTAVAAAGYQFKEWDRSGGFIITDNPYVATWIESDQLTAVFTLLPVHTVVTLGSHTFTLAPQPSKQCSIYAAILEMMDGYDHVHVMGKQNPAITLTVEEVSQNALKDLVLAYQTEAEIALNIPNFEEGALCRIETLDYKELPGIQTGVYYQADVTVVLTQIPTASYSPVGSNMNASFGDVAFPINPQNLTKTFTRNVIKQTMLGQGQKISSTNVSLIRLHLDGVLTGDHALQTMYNLEALLYSENPQMLVTPNETSGIVALLTDLTFNPEKIKFFEQQIPFSAEFIVVPGTLDPQGRSPYILHPTWTVQIETQVQGVFSTVYDVLDIEVDRAYGGQAASFKLTLDNSKGQYAYPINLDYMRNVKIWLKYSDTYVTGIVPNQVVSPSGLIGAAEGSSRLWGIIDEISYSVTKGQGSTVQIQGRDWLAYMMEGWLLDDYTYATWYPDEIVKGPSAATLALDPLTAGHGLLQGTPIGQGRLGTPNYDKYWNVYGVGDPRNKWPSSQTANNTQRAELLQKICQLYRMNFFMDAGEQPGETCPNLVWAEQPRLSMLTVDAPAGSTTISIDYPLLFQQWIGESIVIASTREQGGGPGSPEIIHFTGINGNIASLSSPLSGTYLVSEAAFISNWNQGGNPLLRPPLVKTWGQNIMGISPARFTGTPLRNRIEVYGDGVYAIADAASPVLLPSGSANPGYIAAGATIGGTNNLITNPSFETGVWNVPVGPPDPNGWQQVAASSSPPAPVKYGTYSGRLQANGANKWGAASNTVSVNGLTSAFSVGAFVYTNNLGHSVEYPLGRALVGDFIMTIQCVNAARTVVLGSIDVGSISTATQSWQHLTKTVYKSTLPSGTAYVSLQFHWFNAYGNPVGMAYVDGVQLVNGSVLTDFNYQVVSGGDPGLQQRYGKRREIIEDDSIKSIYGSGGLNCQVYAYTELIKVEYPDREIHILCEGDPIAFPGAIVKFTDNGYTGLSSGILSGYILTATTERLTVNGGYITELVLSKLTQTISPALLTNVINSQAQKMSGGGTLNNTKTTSPMLGTVVSTS